jgi:hypothetical protein
MSHLSSPSITIGESLFTNLSMWQTNIINFTTLFSTIESFKLFLCIYFKSWLSLRKNNGMLMISRGLGLLRFGIFGLRDLVTFEYALLILRLLLIGETLVLKLQL